MAALPYMQLYVADYLADTVHLTTEQHGAYLMLLFNYWQTGKPIPESRASIIAKLPADRWVEYRNVLAEFFEIDANGRWNHKRMDADLKRTKRKSVQAKRAGEKSGKVRRSKKREPAQEDTNGRSHERTFNGRSTGVRTDADIYIADTYTEQKRTEKTLKTPLIIPPAGGSQQTYSQAFEDAWDLYPPRDGSNPKQRAWKAWRARLKEGHDVDELTSGIERYKRYLESKGSVGSEFVQQAATFFGPSKGFKQPWSVNGRNGTREFLTSEQRKVAASKSAVDEWLNESATTTYEGIYERN